MPENNIDPTIENQDNNKPKAEKPRLHILPKPQEVLDTKLSLGLMLALNPNSSNHEVGSRAISPCENGHNCAKCPQLNSQLTQIISRRTGDQEPIIQVNTIVFEDMQHILEYRGLQAAVIILCTPGQKPDGSNDTVIQISSNPQYQRPPLKL